MAENNWGKAPPKGKSFLSPDMIKASFWGPAEVPDQVRGKPRVTTWGGPRPWEEGERPTGIEKGAHDSWVSGEAKKGTMQSSFTGSSGETTGSTYSAEGVKTEKPEGSAPTVREQKGGDADSWVGGEIKKGTMQSSFTGTDLNLSTEEKEKAEKGELGGSSFTGTDLETSGKTASGRNLPPAETTGSTYSAEGVKTEKPEGIAPTVREQLGGEQDSWVGGEIKKGTMQSSFTASTTDAKIESWVGGLVREQKAGKGTALKTLVREQKGGEAESWVGGETKKGTKQSSFTPTLVGGENNSWVGGEIKKGTLQSSFTPTSVGGENDSWVGGFNKNGAKSDKGEAYNDGFIGGWNFKVKIDNIPETHSKFVSISGLTMETENIEFKYGEDKYLRRIPGKEKFGEVELTRIYQPGSSGFAEWRTNISNGRDDLRNVTIEVYHTSFETFVMEIKLSDAYISKWEAPELNAGASDGAVEKITLVPHHIIVQDKAKAMKPPNLFNLFDALLGAAKSISLFDVFANIKNSLDNAMKKKKKPKKKNAQEDREKQAKKAAEFRKKQEAARKKKADKKKKAQEKAQKKSSKKKPTVRRDW